MTESEAIEFVKAFLECKDKEHAVDFNYQCDKDCESCELNYSKGTIGQQTEAMEIAIMALGKQIPKKPVHDGCFDSEGMWHEWNGVNGRPYDLCPNCNTNLCCEMPYDNKQKYCKHCGQRLDWSDEE